MTVQQDMQKAVAAAEAAQGSYMVFSNATQDQSTKQMFQDMANDMQRHIEQMKGRLTYLQDNNSLNSQSSQ